MLAWFTAFHAEADEQAGREPDPESGEHNTLDSVLVRIREGIEWLWELPDGTVAHLTGSGLPSYGVARIGPVYTPREHRGRGIASFVVGELTRRGLEAGNRMCLFTDRANPTSNKIYAGLGYEPVVEMAEHLVTVPGEALASSDAQDPAPHPVPRGRRRRRCRPGPPRRSRARAAPVHAVGGCELFPADNPWNRRIDDRPVWKQSRAIVAAQAAGHDLHLDLGTTEEYYGIPVNVVDEDQPLLPLQFGVDGEDYGDESDRGPVFVPADAAIEGGSTADPDPDSGDRHVITVRRGTCDLVELYAAERVRDSSGKVVAWRAAAAARWDLSSNRLRPARWTSADAAGLPILPGLLSYEEAASGRITHALRFTLPSCPPRVHVAGPPLRPERQHGAGPAGVRHALPVEEVVPDGPLLGRGQGRRGRDEALRAGLRRPGLGDVRHRHRGPALGRRPRPVPRAPARRSFARGREAVEADRPLLTVPPRLGMR